MNGPTVLVDTHSARRPTPDSNRIVRASEVLYRPGAKALTAGNPDGLSRPASSTVPSPTSGFPTCCPASPGTSTCRARFLLDRSPAHLDAIDYSSSMLELVRR